MTKPLIAFRIKDETYLRLAAIAAEKGLSVSVYLKNKLEEEDENLLNDIRLMQTDLKDILNILEEKNKQNSFAAPPKETRTQLSNNTNYENVLLETLMILREVAQPMKLKNAQTNVLAVGLIPYSVSENSK